MFTSRIEVTGPEGERFDQILTPAAVDFVAKLDNAFAGRRRELLDERRLRAEQLASGELVLGFLAHTRHTRKDESWTVAGHAAGLEDRRVEVTAAPTPDGALRALNSGAKVWLADLSEAIAPTWANVIGAQLTLSAAIRRDLEVDGRTVDERPATVVLRPRGWHLVDKHIRIDGRPVSASLVDFGLFFFHNARQLLARGSGPYFSLPKLENHLEARLWNDVFLLAQKELGLPRGSVRATVEIDSVTAVFEMDEILYELREHSAGLSAGRLDYLASMIRTFRADPGFLLPERADLPLTTPFLRAATELLVRTCHRRGAHAIGPVPDQPGPDTEQQAGDGFDGTRIEDAALVTSCRAEFDRVLGERPNQVDKLRQDVVVTAEDLLDTGAASPVSESALRASLSLSLRYLDSWLRGEGTTEVRGHRTDTSAAELARCQVWQWTRHGGTLDDGTEISTELVTGLLDGELAAACTELGAGNRLGAARDILLETALEPTLPGSFSAGAYARHLTESR